MQRLEFPLRVKGIVADPATQAPVEAEILPFPGRAS
jgi:hypothetical protein